MTILKRPETVVRTALPPPRVRRYRAEHEPEPRSRISTVVIYIVVAVLITAVGLLYLIQTNHVAGLGHAMNQMQRERSALALRNEQLNYSVARYESLAAIESVAVGRLGMTRADDHLFMTVPKPENDQLVLPDPPSSGDPSLVERVWRSLGGSASAGPVSASAADR